MLIKPPKRSANRCELPFPLSFATVRARDGPTSWESFGSWEHRLFEAGIVVNTLNPWVSRDKFGNQI